MGNWQKLQDDNTWVDMVCPECSSVEWDFVIKDLKVGDRFPVVPMTCHGCGTVVIRQELVTV